MIKRDIHVVLLRSQLITICDTKKKQPRIQSSNVFLFSYGEIEKKTIKRMSLIGKWRKTSKLR